MTLRISAFFFHPLLITVCSKLGTGKDEAKPHVYMLEYDGKVLGNPFLPKENPLIVEGVKLGRFLFYNPFLSSNNEMSCGTCHIQEKSFTDVRKLAIGTYGDILTKNTMSLVNLAWSKQFFWDGREVFLEQLTR